MSRISLFEGPEDEPGFEAAWHAERGELDARLLRSHSQHTDFRFVELAPHDAPAPELPARTHTARYEVVSDDLPADAPWELVLVNPFEIPTGEDDGFVTAWTAIRDLVKGREGYLGSRLNRALEDGAAYRYVNVSPWGSVSAFTAAVTDQAFARAARTIYHRAHPSLYVAAR